MDQKTEKFLENLEGKKIGVFCDDSNLYHSYKKYGWRIDFGKFRDLLEKHCDLKFIHYHIAIPDKSDYVIRGTKDFLFRIKPSVILKKKLLKYTPIYEENMAWELRQCWHLYLNRVKEEIGLK